MSQKESWGAIIATKEAHTTQRGQPPRLAEKYIISTGIQHRPHASIIIHKHQSYSGLLSCLEVSAGSCSVLPLRSLLSNPGHQKSQFPPLNETGVTLCSFCPYFHKPGPCILGGWPSVWNGFHWHSDCSPGFFPTHS